MNRKTTSKGQQEANPEMTMLVYREMSYPAREVQGKDGNYLVSVERLEQEIGRASCRERVCQYV